MYKINTTVERESKDVARKLSECFLISLHHILSLLPLSVSISLCLLPLSSSHPAVQVTLAQAGRLPLCEGGPLDDKKQEGNLGALMILLCVFV